jgi:hypothetical protein
VTSAESAIERAEERYERRQLGESFEQRARTDVHLDHDPVRAANFGDDFLDPA